MRNVDHNADVMYVDVEGKFEICYDPGNNKHVPCTYDYFAVYINHGDEAPKISVNKIFGKLTFVYNITSSTKPNETEDVPFKETFSFNRNNTKGVTLAVRSRGACGKIFNITMYYYFCEERFIHSVKLKNTCSPKTGFKLVRANCSEHSIASGNTKSLEGRCYSNGSWSVNETNKCLCTKGYEPNEKTGCSRKLNNERNNYKTLTANNTNAIPCNNNEGAKEYSKFKNLKSKRTQNSNLQIPHKVKKAVKNLKSY